MILPFDPKPLPDDIKKTVPQALLRFSSFNTAPAALRQMLQASAQGSGQWWKVSTLGLPDVLEGGKGIDGARAGGWRIAARSGEEVIAADIYMRDPVRQEPEATLEADPPKLACIRRGGEILNMFNKIQELPKLTSSNNIPEQPFFLDLLLLPGLVTEALWLRPKDPTQKVSYVVPFNTLIKQIDREKVYSGTDFIQVVRPTAEHWHRYREHPPSEPRY
jgi:hypothetical protein